MLHVPVAAREAVVLGLMRMELFRFRIVELDSEGLEASASERRFIEIELDSDLRSGAHSWAEVTTFGSGFSCAPKVTPMGRQEVSRGVPRDGLRLAGPA